MTRYIHGKGHPRCVEAEEYIHQLEAELERLRTKLYAMYDKATAELGPGEAALVRGFLVPAIQLLEKPDACSHPSSYLTSRGTRKCTKCGKEKPDA